MLWNWYVDLDEAKTKEYFNRYLISIQKIYTKDKALTEITSSSLWNYTGFTGQFCTASDNGIRYNFLFNIVFKDSKLLIDTLPIIETKEIVTTTTIFDKGSVMINNIKSNFFITTGTIIDTNDIVTSATIFNIGPNMLNNLMTNNLIFIKYTSNVRIKKKEHVSETCYVIYYSTFTYKYYDESTNKEITNNFKNILAVTFHDCYTIAFMPLKTPIKNNEEFENYFILK